MNIPYSQLLFNRCIRALLGGVIFSCSSLLESVGKAGITFDFDFSDNTPGIGFLDPVSGDARRVALETAGNKFSILFGSHFSNSATLSISVTSQNTGLAGAGSNGTGAPGFGAGEVVRNKLISNGVIDLNGASNDGFLNVNWDGGFDYQLDPNAPVNYNGNQIDFFSVIDHELTHAFGFGSNIPGDGIVGANYSYTKWDEFLSSKTLGPVVDPITGLVNIAAYNDAQTNGGLFIGPNAIAAFGKGVPLTVDPDISHLNLETFTLSTTTEPTTQVPFNALMRGTSLGNDLFVPRGYVPAEIGILADLGYAAVPEPSSVVLLIAGIGVMGLVRKRAHSPNDMRSEKP